MVAALHVVVAARNDDLPLAQDGADDAEQPALHASQGHGRQVLGQHELEDLRVAVLELGEELGARHIDVPQDASHRRAARRQDDVDADLLEEPLVGEDIRTRHDARHAEALGEQRHEQVLLVVAGHGDEHGTLADPLRLEQVEVRAVAVEDEALQMPGDLLAA